MGQIELLTAYKVSYTTKGIIAWLWYWLMFSIYKLLLHTPIATLGRLKHPSDYCNWTTVIKQRIEVINKTPIVRAETLIFDGYVRDFERLYPNRMDSVKLKHGQDTYMEYAINSIKEDLRLADFNSNGLSALLPTP